MRRRLIWVVSAATVFALTACGSTTSGTSTSTSAQPATAMREAADRLITTVAQEVVPGAEVTPSATDNGPLACGASGVYYVLYRKLNAASGATGASIVKALGEQFSKHGFAMGAVQEQAGVTQEQGSSGLERLVVAGAADAADVTIIFSTACGRP